jgi:hypothetical protein
MINSGSTLANRFYEHGRLDDCPIYDFHAHMHEFNGGYIPRTTPGEMVRMMERAGTRLTLFCSHRALFMSTADGEQANVEAVRAWPAHFKAYRGIISRHTDVGRAAEEIAANPDIYVGAKFLCDYYGVALSDKRHIPMFEFLDRNKLLCLVHTWGGSPYNGVDEVRKIAERYPDIVLVCGHSFYGRWDDGIELALHCPNIFFEMTALHPLRGVVPYLVEHVGSHRLLFGTDLPWFSTYTGMGAILGEPITDDDMRNIFYRNGQRLLARFPWFTDEILP